MARLRGAEKRRYTQAKANEMRLKVTQLLFDQLVEPGIPVAASAVLEAAGKSTRWRDMKAVFLILEIARDMMVRGIVSEANMNRVPNWFQQLEEKLGKPDGAGGDGARATARWPEDHLAKTGGEGPDGA